MSHSNALPLFDLSFELRVASLEGADMVKLPLSRLTSSKGVACALQSDLVARVDGDAGQRTLAPTRLADAVCCG